MSNVPVFSGDPTNGRIVKNYIYNRLRSAGYSRNEINNIPEFKLSDAHFAKGVKANGGVEGLFNQFNIRIRRDRDSYSSRQKKRRETAQEEYERRMENTRRGAAGGLGENADDEDRDLIRRGQDRNLQGDIMGGFGQGGMAARFNALGNILGRNPQLANALMGGGFSPAGWMTNQFVNALPNMVNALNQGIARDMYANRDQRNFLRQGQFAEKRWNDYMALMRDMMGNKLELGKGYLAALPDYAKGLGTAIAGINAVNPGGPQAIEDKDGIDAFSQAVEPTEVLPELAHFAGLEGAGSDVARGALGRAQTEYGSDVVDPGLDASRQEFTEGHAAAAKGIHGMQAQSNRGRDREANERKSKVNRATGLAIADLQAKVNKAGLANTMKNNMIRNSMDMFNMGIPGINT